MAKQAKAGRPAQYKTAREVRDHAMAVRGMLPAVQAAARARMDATHLWRLVGAGHLRGEAVGRWRYIQRKSLAAYLGDALARELGLLEPLHGERVRG
jgi:hypothetical protein